MREAQQVWLCSFIDDTTKETWEFEVTSWTPMAQANAEVSGIKKLMADRPDHVIRCARSRFVREL